MEDQTKRLLLAIGISFAFIFLWQSFFMPAPPPPEEKPAEAVEPAPGTTMPPAQILAAPLPAPARTIVPVRADAERTVTVKTPLYTVVVTNRGAGVKSFSLSRYLQDAKDPASSVQMVRLLPESAAPPLSCEITGGAGPIGLGSALFVMEGGDLEIPAGGKGELVFKLRTPEGFEVVRTFSFSGDDYAVRLTTRLVNGGPSPISGTASLDWTTGLEMPAGGTKDKTFISSKYAYSGAVYFQDGKTRKFKAKNLKEPAALDRAPVWISTQDVYFVAALLPGNGMSGGAARVGPDGRVQVGLTSKISLPSGGGTDLTATAFIGPKDSKVLAAVDPSLDRTIELGMFSIIAKPLLALLKFFYKYIPNYGVAIILLTILIKVIFIPFTNISHRSMKKMSQLQPQINALRDRYKKDRDKLNQEIMELYKTNKVNPAGGCLPMLAQIPVFFALYKALLGAIELRHAPFALWITDLSAKDPLYITPIIMGGTMVLQQKMTPTSMDPRQAQLMMFLPIVFTAMFLSFPSGLVLYWLMNNVLTIGHQYLLNRADDAAAPAAPEAPVKGKGRKK